ncbi:MAG: hypothetical protein HFJ23_08525 [Clostridia bacterium]|nr:hypothetical protein [Clostridia bacterium]
MKIREESGITLVALIITIIVLVILAAVTINAAFNSGIIDTAVNGAVNYADAQKKEQITFDDLDKNIQDIVNKIEDYNIGGNNPIPTPPQDGSWNGEVNTPKVEGTGLIPVYHNGSTWVDLTENSTEDEWNNWYSYDTTNKKWANARTADGSMWVWIPRYEYKIDSTAKTIDVRFIKTDVKAGTSGYTTDSTGIVKSSDDYIVHPAFMNDTANGFNNGGWDKELAGVWIAKYPAGWQNGTDGETSIGTPERSSKEYQTTSVGITYDGSTSPSKQMSYPEFKSNTYAYNYITIGDAYTLSQDIKDATRYGLRNVDSHLQKNSEWGAVAYLAHSKYGMNGAEVTINDTSKNNSPTGIYAVTSPETVTNTSTTQNITGVYDMSGCVWEYTVGFLLGSNPSYAAGITITNSKYVTVYTENENKQGDAIMETKKWHGDCADFVSSSYPIFTRGGSFNQSEGNCGVFAFGLDADFVDKAKRRIPCRACALDFKMWNEHIQKSKR